MRLTYDLQKYLNQFAENTSVTDYFEFVAVNINDLDRRLETFEDAISISTDGFIERLNIDYLKVRNINCEQRITSNELQTNNLSATNYRVVPNGSNRGSINSSIFRSNHLNDNENHIGAPNGIDVGGKILYSLNTFYGIQTEDIDLQCNLEQYSNIYDVDITKNSTIILDYHLKTPDQECIFRLPIPQLPSGKIGQKLTLVILLPESNATPVYLHSDNIRNITNGQTVAISKNWTTLDFIFVDAKGWILKRS